MTAAACRSPRCAPRKPGEAIVRFEGVADRNAAESAQGPATVRAARGACPRRRRTSSTTPICRARGRGSGTVSLGRVRALHNFGAGDVMEIETPAGATEFIPFNATSCSRSSSPTRIVIAPA